MGKGAFNFVSKTLEFAFLSDTGHGYPIAVVFAVMAISTLFIIHALLGVRKFPISWKQHRILRDQMQMLDHGETQLWYIQVVTGFLMFFAGSVHLYVIFSNPGSIGPYMSADRIVSGNMWPLYFVLLVCVVLHGNIGLYRLCMKWGWFAGKDARKSRLMLRKLKNKIIIFYLTIGILALLVFVVIGINHRDKVGERYDRHTTTTEEIQVSQEAQPVESSHALKETQPVEAPHTMEETKTDEAPHALEESQPVETHQPVEVHQPVEETQPVEESHE